MLIECGFRQKCQKVPCFQTCFCKSIESRQELYTLPCNLVEASQDPGIPDPGHGVDGSEGLETLRSWLSNPSNVSRTLGQG